MTEEDYQRQFDQLNVMLGSIDSTIQQIAEMEISGAWAKRPRPFRNDALTAAKDRAVEQSSKIIEAMARLHKEFNSAL
jgi:pyridoxine/pyridoxamine 5'-phosphate oxidase